MNLLFNIKSMLIYLIVGAVAYLFSPFQDDVMDIVFALGCIWGLVIVVFILLSFIKLAFNLVSDATKIHLIANGLLSSTDRGMLEMVKRGMRGNTRGSKEVQIAKAVLTMKFGRDNKWWLQEVDHLLDKGLYEQAVELLEEHMGPSRLSAYIRTGYWHPLWWF